MNTKKSIIIGVSLLAIGYAAGRFSAPDKTKTTIEYVEVKTTKENKTKEQTKSQQKNTQTRTIITEYPDGKKVTEIFVVNKDTIFIENKEKISKETTKKVAKKVTKTVERNRNQWALGIKAAASTDRLTSPNYGLMVERRILGPFLLGAHGDITGDDKRYGVFLKMEF